MGYRASPRPYQAGLRAVILDTALAVVADGTPAQSARSGAGGGEKRDDDLAVAHRRRAPAVAPPELALPPSSGGLPGITSWRSLPGCKSRNPRSYSQREPSEYVSVILVRNTNVGKDVSEPTHCPAILCLRSTADLLVRTDFSALRPRKKTARKASPSTVGLHRNGVRAARHHIPLRRGSQLAEDAIQCLGEGGRRLHEKCLDFPIVHRGDSNDS